MEPTSGIVECYYISSNGKVIFRKITEKNLLTYEVISKTSFPTDQTIANLENRIKINFPTDAGANNSKVEWFKMENYVYDIAKAKINIPSMIRCQNCETNYPTKYQYQRHQCKFNAEKVILKPNANLSSKDSKEAKVKFECKTCGKQFVSKTNLERHQTSHENPKDNICEFCNKQFVSENRLRIHKENHCKKSGDISKFYRSDVTVWKCKKCNEVFSSSNTAIFHLESCTAIFQTQFATTTDIIKQEPDDDFEKGVEKISTEILLQCEFCNRTYADKQVLLGHQRGHKTDKNYECVICFEMFDSYIIAAQHWLKKCSEKANLFYLPKLTYCEFCDRTFKSHEILYTHKIKKKHYTAKIHNGNSRTEKRDKNVQNQDIINKLVEDVLIALDVTAKKGPADKENVNPVEKEVHIKTEPSSQSNESLILPEKKKRGRKRKLPKAAKGVGKKINAVLEHGLKYQCERCTDVFDTVADLESHREKEHAANFNCEDCGQVLHSARALLIHSRAHKSLKPYVCDTCGRSYSQTSHLWQHMRFHQGIKPFACPHEGCEARYTIRPDLKDHIRKVHTRERPFKCSVCGKCFLTGSVYYQHRLIHTEDRRYGCDMCEKRFFRADALNNHKRIHTNERPYPCFVCGRLFRQKGDRNKHFRTQHPDAIIN